MFQTTNQIVNSNFALGYICHNYPQLSTKQTRPFPLGLVFANEPDKKTCYLLVISEKKHLIP